MDIFLSRPTWVPSEFEEGLKIFLMTLANIGLNPRTLGSSDYPSKAPLDEVIEIMDQCQGAIILGYPQISIEAGNIKSHSISKNLVLATEWNHIEAALAYSKGLPIIVLHHSGISRGVFDRGVMNAFVHEVDLALPSWCLSTELNGAIQKWKANCVSGNSNFGVIAKIDSSKPLCPNCSTKTKPIYLSSLPPSFKEFGKWKCSICNYLE